MKYVSLAILLVLAGALSQATAADAKAGEELYQTKCRSCHGPDGQGKEALEKLFQVEMKALGSKEVQDQTDEQLAKVVTAGYGKMPAVNGVSDSDVSDIIAFVRTLKKTD